MNSEQMKTFNQRQIEMRIQLQTEHVKAMSWQTCLNCTNFMKDTEMCDIYRARPPAHIIVSGCSDYMIDIPF